MDCHIVASSTWKLGCACTIVGRWTRTERLVLCRPSLPRCRKNPALDAGEAAGKPRTERFWGVGWLVRRHFVRTGWATFRRARRSAGQLVSQVCTSSTSVLHQLEVVEPGLRSGAAGFPGTQRLFLRPLRYSHVLYPISLFYGKHKLEFCYNVFGNWKWGLLVRIRCHE